MTAFPTPSDRPLPRASRPRPPATLSPPVLHPSSEAARLRQLIDAQRVINGTRPLPDVLTRIVGSACDLAGARYGALAVFGPDDRLEQLVQSGADGPFDPATVVVGDANGDTTSFLGVPIVVRDDRVSGVNGVSGVSGVGGVDACAAGAVSVVGELYLAESRNGRFTADDEELVTALAETAGAAIVNARLHEESRRSHEWAHASHEITRALLAGADVDMVLEVVSQALGAADADTGVLALPGADGVLRATVTVGLGAERLQGWTFCPEASGLAALMTAGTPVLHADLRDIANPAFVNAENFGPVMGAPLIDAKGVRGSVLLVRTADRAPFTESEIAHLTTFADQVALALDLDDARDDAEWLRVLEVRHQLAKDLHDNIIQRLFATGMGLHSIAAAKLPSPADERLPRYVAELDETIDEVRERVFGLQEASRNGARGVVRFPRLRTKGAEPQPPQPTRRAPSPRPPN